ncbi:MAG: hypothetical protein RL740_490, partial [Actinomycetota bacterium]
MKISKENLKFLLPMVFILQLFTSPGFSDNQDGIFTSEAKITFPTLNKFGISQSLLLSDGRLVHV